MPSQPWWLYQGEGSFGMNSMGAVPLNPAQMYMDKKKKIKTEAKQQTKTKRKQQGEGEKKQW